MSNRGWRHLVSRIEDDIRGRSADERHAIRQEIAALLWPISNPGCARSSAWISQKTKLAEAIRYTLSRWQDLSRFLDDGRIEIDRQHRRALNPSNRHLGVILPMLGRRSRSITVGTRISDVGGGGGARPPPRRGVVKSKKPAGGGGGGGGGGGARGGG
ncbi:IS66 family transposase, partial [Mesorhizobium caraganae]|uniref:IS66 family transposase n=1 Tax=Mesorhizobium caraganae TaxID=483206 RepID=UPI003EBDB449